MQFGGDLHLGFVVAFVEAIMEPTGHDVVLDEASDDVQLGEGRTDDDSKVLLRDLNF